MHVDPRDRDRREDGEEQPAGRRVAPPSSDMNVTPLIDVLLVLLVTFMAALPLAQMGMDISLPLETKVETTPPPELTQIVVELSPELELTVNKKPVELPSLDVTLRELFEGRTDRTVFIVGPPTARYGDVVSIIDVANGIGLRIALVTEGMRRAGLGTR